MSDSDASLINTNALEAYLKFFPSGFICHDGAIVDLAAQQAKLAESGALYRIQGPFGEQP